MMTGGPLQTFRFRNDFRAQELWLVRVRVLASECARNAKGKIAGRLYDGWTPRDRGRIERWTSRKYLRARRDTDQNKSTLRIQHRYAGARLCFRWV